jgi:hypothetical protein
MKTKTQTDQLLAAGNQLRAMLHRCEISCESLWHHDGERHRGNAQCPVVAKIEAAQKAWDEIVAAMPNDGTERPALPTL